jgi:hypothetical protein
MDNLYKTYERLLAATESLGCKRNGVRATENKLEPTTIVKRKGFPRYHKVQSADYQHNKLFNTNASFYTKIEFNP